MSQTNNHNEALRWLITADEDFQAAKTLAQSKMHALSCFHAQQCAEKAMKALWYHHDLDPWGHSVLKLYYEFPDQTLFSDPIKQPWITYASLLDKLYIPTRYPNGLPGLTPGQVYNQSDSDVALTAAQFIYEQCKALMAANESNV